MCVGLAAPPPATAPLARISNSGLYGKRFCRSTHRRSAVTIRSVTASAPTSARDQPAATRIPRLRHSNPHSARATATRSPSAVSSLGGFRTPALGVRGTVTHRAGIRNPSQQTTFAIGVRIGRLKARVPQCPPSDDQLSVTPALSTTLAHFTTSASSIFRNASGEVMSGSAP